VDHGLERHHESIHRWAWWFAVLCPLVGGIGVLLTGAVVDNWYLWSVKRHVVAILPRCVSCRRRPRPDGSETMNFQLITSRLLGLLACAVVLQGCGERPPIASVQTGYRGTGMEQVYNPRILATKAALNQAPAPAEAASPDGPRAKEVYQNVKVLGDLSVAEFSRHMASITQWVAPNQGCNYCHVTDNFADDSKYTKVVARRMIQMTQHVNGDWKNHVGETGVTCYTCHRGNPVPKEVWFAPVANKRSGGALGDDGEQIERQRQWATPRCRTILSRRTCNRTSRFASMARRPWYKLVSPPIDNRPNRPSSLTA